MKGPCVPRRCTITLALLIVPPVFWAIVLAFTPTEWARQRVEAGLARSTGRPTRLGSLRLGVLGGVHLDHLAIGPVDDPWLKVDSARVDLSLLELMAGQLGPEQVQVDGLAVRILRRSDGSLELGDLMAPAPAAPVVAAPGEASGPAVVEVQFRNARITVIDEPSGSKLELSQAEGLATSQGRRTAVRDLRGLLNGGRLQLTASLDCTGAVPAFEAQLHVQGVENGEGTRALAYVVPVLAETAAGGAVEGRMDGDLYLRGSGATTEALRQSLVGQGSIHVDPLELAKSQFVAALGQVIELPRDHPSSSLKTDFTIKDQRVTTSDLTVVVAKVPVVLAGWTDFDGHVDYRVRSESLTNRLSSKARGLLSDLAVDPNDLAGLRLLGTLDDMDVTSELGPGDVATGGAGSSRRTLDRQKVRDLGRRVRDRILR